MDESNPSLKSFKSVIGEFFYDWGGFGHSNPQIRKNDDGSFWINKTDLSKRKDGTIELSYKTWNSEVEEIAFLDFCFFYENLYKDDSEFDELMGQVADSWFTQDGENQGKIIKEEYGYNLNGLKIITNQNDPHMEKEGHKTSLSLQAIEKFKAFASLVG